MADAAGASERGRAPVGLSRPERPGGGPRQDGARARVADVPRQIHTAARHHAGPRAAPRAVLADALRKRRASAHSIEVVACDDRQNNEAEERVARGLTPTLGVACDDRQNKEAEERTARTPSRKGEPPEAAPRHGSSPATTVRTKRRKRESPEG